MGNKVEFTEKATIVLRHLGLTTGKKNIQIILIYDFILNTLNY